MKSLASKIVISVIAILLVVGTFFLQEKFSVSAAKPQVETIQVVSQGKDASIKKEADHYLVSSGKTGPLVIVVTGNVVLRLSPDGVAEIGKRVNADFTETLTLNLKNGRVWLNNLNSPNGAKITFANAADVPLVIAEPGVFDIKYQDPIATIRAYRRSAEVNILLINAKLILPEGHQMEISKTKISASADVLAKLRYSKLAKEFPFYELQAPDEWVLGNKKMDETFAVEYAKKIEDDVRESGPTVGADENSLFSKLNGGLRGADIALTFDSAKKERKEADRAFSYFDAGVYAALIGKDDLAKKWFDEFKQRSIVLRGRSDQNLIWNHNFMERFDRFSYLTPNQPLFEVKKALEDAATTPFEKVHFMLRDILDIASIGSDDETMVKILTMLRQFGYLVSSNIQTLKNASDADVVFFDSMRLNGFLDKYPALLKEEFLKISQLYERAYLNYVAANRGTAEADDQREFLVAEKLDRINLLKTLIEKGDLPFQETRSSILYLASQIDILKPTISDKAILTYFDDRLKGLGSFLAFLHSAGAENMRGSFADNYNQFQQDIQQMKQVNELLKTAAGGTQISPYRREELVGIVTADFVGLGASNIKILLPEEEGDPRVKVTTAQIENKSFKATYDTAQKVFSGIEFDETKIPNAVRLENLKKFLLLKLGKLTLPSGESADTLVEPVSQQSLVEKVAKASLLADLQKLNISVDEKYLGLESLGEGIIHVRLAVIGEGTNAIMFAFDVEQKTSVVSNLKVKTVSGEVPVNETFTLRELSTRVNQVYQRAVFDKQKEEEMKKFLETAPVVGGTTTSLRSFTNLRSTFLTGGDIE